MAKVYSWAISETKFGYIINPNDVDKNVLNGNANPYITDIKLTGDDLNAVKIWASTCSDDEYIEQFTKLKDLCRTENIKVNFENVESYLNVSSTCDNLSGPEGKEGVGIVDIRYKEDLLLENKTRYEIELSNGEIKFLDIQNGAKGDKGDNADKALSAITIFAYKSGVNENGEEITIDTPTGGSYNFTNSNLILPEGWSNTDSLTPPIFMSSATFKTTKDSDICNNPTWNAPIQITGDNGEPGADGITTEFIYKRTSSNRLTEGEYPSNPTTDEEKKVNEFVPDGWSDSPSGVDEDHKYEWMSIRKFDKNSGMWREWSTPALWSKYGENGQDGDGVQYIYALTENGTPPSNPCPDEWADDKDYQEKNREWLPGTDGNIYDNALGKYIKWTDNPSGTTTTNPYEWVCVRKYKQDGDNKKWGQFSNPSLWAKYGENGKSGTIVRKLYRLMKNSNTSDVPDLPQEDYYGQWTSSFPSNFNIATDVVWETEAELYADTYEFVGRYKNAYTITETENSSGDIITTITNPTTDKNGNIIVPTPAPDNIIPNEKIKDSEGNLAEYINITLEGQDYYYKWSEGWDTPKIITGVKGDTSAPINDTRYLYYFGENMPSNNGLIGVNFSTFEDSDGGIIDDYTWYNFPYENRGVDNDAERWYRCLCYVNGSTYCITSCGNVEINSAIDGEYTEYRYYWADINTPPYVNNTDIDPNKPKDETQEVTVNWSTTIGTQGNTQHVLWQISARLKRDKTTNTIEFANDGGSWAGPIRITGEKGATGEIGFPGIGFKVLYCLGTKTTYFGNNPNPNTETNTPTLTIDGWYSTQFMRDSNIIKPQTLKEFYDEVGDINNVGRVIQWTINDSGSQPENTSSNNEYVGKIHYYFIKGENDYVDYTYEYPDITEGVYTWMTQGETVYGKSDDINAYDSKYKVVGYNWSIPVKAQGTAGVNGVKGRVIYPAGNYNPYKVYETTADSAPYVYDTSYGNFYLLNIENFKWLGKFDEVYYNSLTDDEKKKYYVDEAIGGTKINDQNGQKPGENYANNGNPYWIKFESLQALYASVAVINMGTVGSAVYADDFMFSQYGLKKDGNLGHYNDNGENNFLSGYERQDDGSYKYNGTTLDPEQIDPYQKDDLKNYIHDFMPSICINFKTGKMWVQNGKIEFDTNSNDSGAIIGDFMGVKDEEGDISSFYNGGNTPTNTTFNDYNGEIIFGIGIPKETTPLNDDENYINLYKWKLINDTNKPSDIEEYIYTVNYDIDNNFKYKECYEIVEIDYNGKKETIFRQKDVTTKFCYEVNLNDSDKSFDVWAKYHDHDSIEFIYGENKDAEQKTTSVADLIENITTNRFNIVGYDEHQGSLSRKYSKNFFYKKKNNNTHPNNNVRATLFYNDLDYNGDKYVTDNDKKLHKKYVLDHGKYLLSKTPKQISESGVSLKTDKINTYEYDIELEHENILLFNNDTIYPNKTVYVKRYDNTDIVLINYLDCCFSLIDAKKEAFIMINHFGKKYYYKYDGEYNEKTVTKWSLSKLKLYENGDIFCQNLKTRGVIEGTINSDGYFNGNIDSDGGSIKNYEITNSIINLDLIDTKQDNDYTNTKQIYYKRSRMSDYYTSYKNNSKGMWSSYYNIKIGETTIPQKDINYSIIIHPFNIFVHKYLYDEKDMTGCPITVTINFLDENDKVIHQIKESTGDNKYNDKTTDYNYNFLFNGYEIIHKEEVEENGKYDYKMFIIDETKNNILLNKISKVEIFATAEITLTGREGIMDKKKDYFELSLKNQKSYLEVCYEAPNLLTIDNTGFHFTMKNDNDDIISAHIDKNGIKFVCGSKTFGYKANGTDW